MDSISYKTTSTKRGNIQRNWILLDASDKPLGRFSSLIAKFLMGKHKSYYSPAVDCSDHVVVINAEKISLSGKKWRDKIYIRHTEYPGGQRKLTAKEVYDKDPKKLIEKAVKGMLPKNSLASKLITKLHLYVGPNHEHAAQKPSIYNYQ